ncbi:CMP-N-acetylneuraminate-beta-galactosamide-alpha-2,3-sialyltransferase 1 [Misgurnus anguillicaudatus]|uniref:CMP-N-acetylneuraminate-beta-galactosamide- alpha-2,3-sialyltransferase 1 n=1 Tax=Misgurnus anguillicaudatus TaxID=75329 RepID=UPI002435C845|nr:CMP-N-acetylneuraminate-beta-galactosamide-alpha-2,3-sialyltransferase 1-like [Misgurnus anguillicaudatus]XP_055076544.1 CMP-N-acetylneuraminate-beta-galactosamide-alpha-2,3-sialyltransferase 1-like [Misgurnus anguillicaudatus]XP_055076545.1 CMP-N-acetylneuraminate-beta-galactosamide-alpha-2,3-sialyltransferase 1-like [Misgurnus anguillicaudatus]XP_055076546.1 CMP-N-acetylneuraminate-beta-galactosamide-alpha-2,3-sialyltransferase 1-like [Misgurnus anguillicaudatus]
MAMVLPKLKPRHHHYVILLLSCTIILCLYFENTWMLLTDNYHVSKRAACVNRTCAPDRERTDWFCARYAPTVQLLLNSSNSALSAPLSSWWRGLQVVKHVANYTALVRNLFPLFPDQKPCSDSHPNHCRTCAVVGNSGNLLGSRYGPLIDSKDCVMRINKGPTGGFEEDVGLKTTHRIFYPESAMDLDNSTHLVFSPFKILDIEWLISVFTTKHITKTYTDVPSTININRDKVMILHPEFMKYVHVNWTENHGRYPSTGFLTVIFALHICDEVHVFGFGATKDGKWHHYFDQTLTPYANESHAGDFEYKTIIRLHREKKLLMYKGWT